MAGKRKENEAGSSNDLRADALRVLGVLKVATADQIQRLSLPHLTYQHTTKPTVAKRKEARAASHRAAVNDLRRHGLAVDGGRTRGGEETRLLTKDGLAAAAIDLDREIEEMGGRPKSAGRSGASHPMTVNETVIALIRPKPNLDLVAGEPAEAVAAARAATDAPDGIGTLASYATEVALPVKGIWKNPAIGSTRADVVLAVPEAGVPLLFIEVDNRTEEAVLIARKFDKYARFFLRQEKDTDGFEKPLWRTRWSARYDVDGTVVKETLPGGYTMTQTGGKAGLSYQRVYTRDSDGEILLTDTVTESVHDEWVTHSGGAGAGESQTYAFDAIGRLITVEDTYDNVCTTRTYAFDDRTNRTGLSTAVAENGADCTASGATTVTHAYDSADRIVDSGYVYDAFGRTTGMPGGTSIAYYVNDLVRQQTTGDTRQTWTLDAGGRFRSWTEESNASGKWTQTGSKTNHYSGTADSPRWITDNTAGTESRMVTGLSGSLSAITEATDAVVLQLANLRGDISLVLSLDSTVAPTALSADEYGRQRTSGAVSGYGWLGGMQRSGATPTSQILMGVRLYNPATGRFLQVDPVVGGSRNAYEYAAANPVSNYDLDGRRVYRYQQRTLYRSWGRVLLKRWSNKSNMKRSYSTTWTLNRRWTNRIAYYGPYASGFFAIASGAAAFIPGAQPVALILLVLSAAALTIGMIAGYAERSGQCLTIYSRTTVVYRKSFGYTHFYYYTGYTYPWRGRC
ncbi:replication-relaxation family protein [Streptomyces prasinus]